MAAKESRRAEILAAAMAEIIERGFDRTTVAGIARRAGASKETLYAWFGDKEGLVTALIEANADRDVGISLPEDIDETHTLEDARVVLTACASGLLRLLTGPESVALNRAAMTSPSLAATLRRSGRGRTGPAIARYLARLDELSVISAPDAAESFGTLYGLVIQHSQIDALLGGPPPTADECDRRAVGAVHAFLRLTAPIGQRS